MANFGELINQRIPVLFYFYMDFQDNHQDYSSMLRDLATEYQSKLIVVKIEKSKNEELFNSLRVNVFPTFMIYKNSQLEFRKSAPVLKEALIEKIDIL